MDITLNFSFNFIKNDRFGQVIINMMALWYLQLPVDQYAHGVFALPFACAELWIIGQGGLFAHQDRIFFCTPFMYQLFGKRPADPLLNRIFRREIPISSCGPF
ncbi:hypothetical protein D3C87_1291870 [compost metagenome]